MKKNDIIFNKQLLDNNMQLIYKKGALFYGLSSLKNYPNKIVATYYQYDIDNQKIVDIKVILNKFDIYNPNYLIFKFNNSSSFFNKKIKYKLVTFKTLLKRLINNNRLYNNFNFITSFVYKEVINVDNIDILYEKHLENIKLQMLKIYQTKSK